MTILSERLWAMHPDAAVEFFAALAEQQRPPGEGPQAAPPAPAGAEAEGGYSLENGVAVISIAGPLTRKAMYSHWSGAKLSSGQDEIAQALRQALADPAARAILLDINSPGGVVAGTKELADAIASASKVKPMAAYADGLMASAAMWLGAATGRVYAPATGTVGSIGVLLLHADFSRLNERLGVAYTYIAAGKYKAAGNEDSPLSPEDRALFQARADKLHALFRADVAAGLGISAPLEQWAEGQDMLALEAERLGLVTRIVRDKSAAVNLLRQESIMDYTTFAAQHPELLAEIEAGAKAAGAAEAEAKQAQAAGSLLALVDKVAGADVRARVEKLAALNFTPAQVEALGEMLPANAARDKKDEILAALNSSGNRVLEGGASLPPSRANKLEADAARRAQ